MTERVQKALDELRTHKYREQRITRDDFDMTEELVKCLLYSFCHNTFTSIP